MSRRFYGVLTVSEEDLCFSILMDRLWIIFFLLGVSGLTAFAEVSEEARKYHQLLLKKPGNDTVFERFLEAWLTTGDREGLEVWLEGEAEGGTVGDWQILATYYEDLGESGEALAALDRGVKMDEGKLSLKLSRAKLRAKGMDFEGALEDLKPVVEDVELGREAMTLRGVYEVRIGRPNDAVRTWEALVKRFPGDEALREDLIEIEIGEGLFERAIESSRSLVDRTKDPYKKALRRLRLAEVYGLADRKEESLATYEKVMAASGEGTWLEREVLSQVEQIYVWEDDVQGLRDYYQKLRENYPRRTSVRKALAKQMARNDELEEAIALFREVLKITPGDLGNREEFVAFLEVNEMRKEASIELEELIKQKGDDPLLWERVVVLKHQLEDEEGLREGLGKLRALKVGDPEGVVAVALLCGQVELAEDREEVLREGRKKFPESAAVTEALAAVLVKTERREEARDLWLSVAASGERDEVLRAARSLARNAMKSEAFELLLKYVRKSPEDNLLVTPLGQFALTPEQAVEATPFLLGMVERATTPTALESSVALVVGLVLRSGREMEVAEKLEKDSDLSMAARCLLAELHSAMGDRMKGREILEKGGEDRLVKFFRVRFEEKEGDLGAAIALLEKILEEPGERKTVHLRRLVDLHQKAGRLSEALERAEEWKKMSPGNKQAWLTKARLLTAGGQREMAVAEYRRIMGKFGADEESRARLAKALEGQRDYQGAGKVYRKLYETAEEQRDELKWVAKWASMMRRIDRDEEVVEVLRARKKSNRRSEGPLLALAEVYEVLGKEEKRREALLEAVRRKPGDWEILLNLAKEAERVGDLESAVKTLKEAMVLEKGDESKRALVELFLRNGEVEDGLALLKSIPGEGADPRQVEKTVASFGRAGNWEIAEKYLAGVLAKHGGDWRLEYLQGLLLIRKGESDKALEIWESLDREVEPLPGVAVNQAKVAANYGDPFQHPRKNRNAMVAELQQLYQRAMTPVGQVEIDPFSSGLGYGSRRSVLGTPKAPLFHLPETPEGLQKRILVRKAIHFCLRKDEAGQKKFGEMIESANFNEKVFLLRNWGGDRYHRFLLAQMEENPGDPEIAWLWMQATTYENDENREVTKRAFALLETELPFEVLKDFSYFFAKIERSAKKGFPIWKELYLGLSDDDKKKILPTLLQSYGYQPDPFSRFPAAPRPRNGDFQEEWNLLRGEVLGLEEPINYPAIYQTFVTGLLATGQGEEAAKLINRCVEWTVAGALRGRPGHQRQRRSQSRFGAVAIPVFKVGGFLDLLRLIHPRGKGSQLGEAQKARQRALLKKLHAGLGGEVEALFPGDVLAPHVHHIKDPLYRGLILMLLNDKEGFAKLVSTMLQSKDAGQLRLVASYHTKRKEFQKVYGCLLQLSELQLDRNERRVLDGHLAYTAYQLSEDEMKEVDLEPAREALMRVQRQVQKGDLQEVMRKLGLNEEADRFERIAQSKQQRKRQQTRPARRISALSGNVLIEKELREGALENAITEVKRIEKIYRSRGQHSIDWSKTLALFEKASQVSPLLGVLKPKGGGTVGDWFQYGGIASQTKMKKEAKEAFEKVLEMEPNYLQARIELFLLGSEEERDWLIFSTKENPELAADLAQTFYNKFSNQRPPSYELMMDTSRAARVFLEGDSETDPRKGINGWISSFLARADRLYQFGDFEIEPLNGIGKAKVAKKDKGKSEERVEEFRKLYEEMMNHGLLADDGFRRLKGGRKLMALTDEELFQYANRAHAQIIVNPDRENVGFYGDPFSGNVGRQLSSNAMGHLLEMGVERKGIIFTEATLAVMLAHRPDSHRNYQFSRKILKAPPEKSGEIYRKWLAGLPEKEGGKSDALIQMNRLLSAFEVEDGEWAELQQKELFSVEQIDLSSLSDWGKWVFKKRGYEGFYQWVFEFCEGALGDRERWPLLAEISPGFRPVEDQRKISRCVHKLKGMAAEPLLAAPLAVAMRRGKLAGLLPTVGTIYREEWRRQTPVASEEFRAWLKSTGGMAVSSEGGQPEAIRLLVFLDVINRSQAPRGKALGQVGEMLDEDVELDSLKKGILKAQWGLPVELSDLFEKNVKVFVEMADSSPFQTARLLGKWFQGSEMEELSKESSDFIKGLSDQIGKKAYGEIMESAQRAGGARAYLSQAQAMNEIAAFASVVPREAARAFEVLVVEALGASESLLTQEGLSAEEYFQQKMTAMSSALWEKSTRVPTLGQWQFLYFLSQSQVGGRLGSFLLNDSRFATSFENTFKIGRLKVAGKFPQYSPAKIAVETLRPMLAQMGAEERRAFLLFIPSRGNIKWGSYREAGFRKGFEWVDVEFRKDFPIAADFLTAVMSRGIYGDQREKFSKEVARGSENLLRFLNESDFPAPLRMKAARVLVSDTSMRVHLSTAEHWEWVGKVIEECALSPVKKDLGIATGLLTYLRPQDFEEMGEIPDVLISSLLETLGGGRKAHIDRDQFGQALRGSVILAVMAKKREFAKRIIEASPQFFSGNLPLQWAIFEAGGGEVLSGLFDPLATQTAIHEFPRFGKDSPAKIKAFVAHFPEEQRFHIELQFAIARDDRGENAPEISQRERIPGLAQRYLKEGGGRREFVLSALGVFARDERTLPILAEHYLAEEKKHLLGSPVVTPRADREIPQLRNIIRAAITIESRQGNFEPALRQFRAILNQPGPEGNYPRDTELILSTVAYEVFRTSMEDPEKAGEFTTLADDFLGEALRARSRSSVELLVKTDAFSSLQYFLAGEVPDVEVEPRSWKEFQDLRKTYPLSAWSRLMDGKLWQREEGESILSHVQGRVFTSKSYLRNANALPGLVTLQLSNYALVKRVALKALMEGLPEELLREPFFLWRAGFFAEGPVEVLEDFSEARAAAKVAGLEEMEAEIMVDMVMKLQQLKRNAEAWVLLNEINLDLIKGEARKDVVKNLKEKK